MLQPGAAWTFVGPGNPGGVSAYGRVVPGICHAPIRGITGEFANKQKSFAGAAGASHFLWSIARFGRRKTGGALQLAAVGSSNACADIACLLKTMCCWFAVCWQARCSACWSMYKPCLWLGELLLRGLPIKTK